MDINKDPRTGDKASQAPKPITLEDQHGKMNFESEREFIEAVKVLTKRGYGFQRAGKVLDKPIPSSNFYGICWGISDWNERELVWFYTTKIEVYAAYQR